MTSKQLLSVRNYTLRVLKKSTDPLHSFEHIDRVRKRALKIVDILGVKGIDLNLLEAICYLHDVPINMFKAGPAVSHFLEYFAVRKYLPKVLDDLKIEGSEREIIFDAIKKHTFTIPYRKLNRQGSLYLRVMQDADSIDFFYTDREKSLLVNKNKYLSYFLLSIFSQKFLSYGRKNLNLYLNFQTLSKVNWFKD